MARDPPQHESQLVTKRRRLNKALHHLPYDIVAPWSHGWHFVEGDLALQKKVTAAQIALSRLEEDLGAASIELTSSDMDEITQALAKAPLDGDRYPEHLEKITGR